MSSKQLRVPVKALGPREPKKPKNWKPPNMRRNVVVVEIRDHTGTPTFSIQPKQSIDGMVWYNLGSMIAAIGLNVLTCECPYFKLTIATILGWLG